MHKKTHFKTIENMLLRSPRIEDRNSDEMMSTVIDGLQNAHAIGEMAEGKKKEMIEMNVNE